MTTLSIPRVNSLPKDTTMTEGQARGRKPSQLVATLLAGFSIIVFLVFLWAHLWLVPALIQWLGPLLGDTLSLLAGIAYGVSPALIIIWAVCRSPSRRVEDGQRKE